MNSGQFSRKRLVAAVGAAVLTIAAGQALGSAFALQEQSGSGLGNAFAGGAAVAEDASTIYFNPAGMARLPDMQAAVAGSLICPGVQFHDTGSQHASLQTLGGTGGDAGSCAGVPALYLSVPINAQWAFGVGVNAPFGLKTNYEDGWLGRFQGLESRLKTLNVNPALSFRANDVFSFGAGFSWQRINATLTNQVNYAAIMAQAAQTAAAGGAIPPSAVLPIIGAYTGTEAHANIYGDDNAYGWNVGVLIEPDKQTRIGIAYRSSISYTINGNASFSTPAFPPSLPAALVPIATALTTSINNGPLANGSISLDLKVPATANVSIFRQVDPKWDLMADVQFTEWHSVQQLQVVRSNGVVLETLPQNFRNTYRASVGANFHYTDQWMFRGGLAYDQSPVNSTDRGPRLPDNNRTWFSVGAQYKWTPQWVFDLGYTYIIVQDPSINQNQGNAALNGQIVGNYRNNVNILALQATYTFK